MYYWTFSVGKNGLPKENVGRRTQKKLRRGEKEEMDHGNSVEFGGD